jgi:translation initiation factor 2B subunit (eIF-2B alpha/beta/delta family)
VKDLRLTRPELVSLMNAFHRVSESVEFNQEFRDMVEKKRKLEKLESDMLIDLNEWVNGMNSRAARSISFWFGLVILLLGLVRLLQKSGEMSKKYEERLKQEQQEATSKSKTRKSKKHD